MNTVRRIDRESTVELELDMHTATILCALLGGVAHRDGLRTEYRGRTETPIGELFEGLNEVLDERQECFSDFFEGEVTWKGEEL